MGEVLLHESIGADRQMRKIVSVLGQLCVSVFHDTRQHLHTEINEAKKGSPRYMVSTND